MDISRVLDRWLLGRGVRRRLPDYLLDRWITEALYDETCDPVPAAVWDRLCKTIGERQFVRSHGMWVLDETFHDPPSLPPASRQVERALRLSRRGHTSHPWQLSHVLWANWAPPLMAIVSF